MRTLNKDEQLAFQQLLKEKQKQGIKRLRAAIYARKSSTDEKETSLSTQISVCTEFIKSYDFLELTATFQEDDCSGMYMDKRTQFLAMLEKAEKREIDVIVVVRIDRISRSAADSFLIFKQLNLWGCTLIAGDDISTKDTPAGEFMRGIMICQNQYQARVTASRVMQSEIHNVQIGDSAGGQPPYGLKVVNKQFEINEDEAPAIRTMFSMAAKGNSYSQIVEKLNSLGYKTRKGGNFTYSTISSMLRNDKYYGTYVYNRQNGKRRKDRVLIEKFEEERNSNAIPPIISKATFDKVQTILDKRKTCRPRQNVNSDYILTGYITCKSCGGSMSGQSNVGGRKNKRSRYYACLNHSSRRNGVCKTKNINADYLENAVKSILTEKINEYLLSAEAESVFSIMKLSKTEEVKSLNKSIKRLRSKYRFVA